MAIYSVFSSLLAAVVDSLIGRMLSAAYAATVSSRKSVPVRGWEALIERHCGDTRFIGIVTEEPRIDLMPRTVLTPEEQTTRATVLPGILRNDPHGMLLEPPTLLSRSFRLSVQPLDYADLEVLRRRNSHGWIISAGALLVCRTEKVIVLHHRSPHSRTYPDALHIVGGAYIPPGIRPDIEDDGHSLFATARREVMEETRAAITLDNDPPIIVSEELSTRFFQFIIHGAEISSRELSMLRENWEGVNIIAIQFDELEKWLLAPPLPWVPTGKAHVLAWLALGAPGAGRRPRFGRYSPKALFNRVVSF
jgi:8-oxo-dGTP pyrophosphatase MutT (NUDIX family)